MYAQINMLDYYMTTTLRLLSAMHACMYVCMYVCMNECLNMCIEVYFVQLKYFYVCVCMHVCMCV